MSRGICRGCGAEITWARTAQGKNIPLEFADPSTNGNIRIDEKGFALVTSRRGTGPYISHFVKCPQAHTFRRDNGDKGGSAA